ncbi:MAG: hypothetical protein R3346_03805 [Candidatus Spechtbacterales bacterium]|nr:hypothetical protein [Candidatus Spechtbacterales bacterium]
MSTDKEREVYSQDVQEILDAAADEDFLEGDLELEEEPEEDTLETAFWDSGLVWQGRHGVESFAERRRRTYGRSWGALHKAVDASKEAIEAHLRGDEVIYVYAMNDLYEAREEFTEIKGDLPPDRAREVQFQIDQEMVEVKFFTLIYDEAVWGEKPERLPRMQDLDVEPEAYLFGIIDAVSEAAKSLVEYLYSTEDSLDAIDRINLRRDFIRVAEEYLEYLEQYFKHFPPYVIPNEGDRRRNFRSNLKSKLYGLKRMIFLKKEKVTDLEDALALQQATWPTSS